MAKTIKTEGLIDVELEKLDGKVQEFQKYLEINSILNANNGIRYDEVEIESQDKLHKEIVIQIKMQDALFSWMPLLKKLREETAAKSMETYGDVEVNGLYRKKKGEN